MTAIRKPDPFWDRVSEREMSDKETVIHVIQQMPDEVSVAEILWSLRKQYGPQAVSLEWDAEEVTDNDWRLFVAQGLGDELNDSDEDIYGSEDGEPINGQG